MTVRVSPWESGPRVARISAGVETTTGTVVITKAAVVPPAGTTTAGGTLAALRAPLVRATETPPVGAGPERVTVPWPLFPPRTLSGVRAIPSRIGAGAGGGLTVRVALLL